MEYLHASEGLRIGGAVSMLSDLLANSYSQRSQRHDWEVTRSVVSAQLSNFRLSTRLDWEIVFPSLHLRDSEQIYPFLPQL